MHLLECSIKQLPVGRWRGAAWRLWIAWPVIPQAVQTADNIGNIWITDWERKQVAITLSLRAFLFFYLWNGSEESLFPTILHSDFPFFPSQLNNRLQRGQVSRLSKRGGFDCWPVTGIPVLSEVAPEVMACSREEHPLLQVLSALPLERRPVQGRVSSICFSPLLHSISCFPTSVGVPRPFIYLLISVVPIFTFGQPPTYPLNLINAAGSMFTQWYNLHKFFA